MSHTCKQKKPTKTCDARNQRRELAANHEQAKAHLEATVRELAGLREQEAEVAQQVLQRYVTDM